MLDEMGLAAFAERARRELAATGETARARAVDAVTTLTAQEACIARLARDGHTNPEISAQLFLSVRTVEWHLRKISSSSASAPAASCAPRWTISRWTALRAIAVQRRRLRMGPVGRPPAPPVAVPWPAGRPD